MTKGKLAGKENADCRRRNGCMVSCLANDDFCQARAEIRQRLIFAGILKARNNSVHELVYPDCRRAV